MDGLQRATTKSTRARRLPGKKTMKVTMKRPRNTYYVSCIGDDGNVRCGGWIKTRATTDAGIVAAARSQVWRGSPPASCGYILRAIVLDPDNTDRARTIAA